MLRLLVVLSACIALLVAVLGSGSPFLTPHATSAAPTVVRVQAAATLAPRVPVVRPTPVALETLLASDDFAVPAQNSWSSAPKGGDYTLDGQPNDFAEQSGTGTIQTPAGDERGATLNDVNARDVDLRVRIQSDRAADGGNQFVYLTLRELDAATNYRARVRFDTAGSVWLQFARMLRGQTELLGTETRVAGFTPTPTDSLWVRAVAVGDQPTTLRLKAWPQGQTEPDSWQYVATDTEQRLASSGTVALRAYVSAQATNAPVTFGFSELRITRASEDLNELAPGFVALPTQIPAPAPAIAVTPVPTPVPPTPAPESAGDALQALEPELSAAWGHDTERTVTLLESFVTRFPNDQSSQEKLYAALLARAQDVASAGDADQAKSLLEQARALLPARGEAGVQLARLAPTPETVDPQPETRVVAPPPAPAPVVRAAPAVSAPARASTNVRAPAPAPPAAPIVRPVAPTPTKVPFVIPAAGN